MKDVMVDLETYGSAPGACILSIGAVEFNATTGQLGREFYRVVNLASCYRVGLLADASTVSWWDKQSPEAREVLDLATTGGYPVNLALQDLTAWLAKCGDAPCVWGNGADFDNAILQVAYRKCDQEAPWKFWHNRCYRTLKNLPGIKQAVPAPVREGTHHHALDDAKFQAQHAVLILNWLQVNLPPVSVKPVRLTEPFKWPTEDQARAPSEVPMVDLKPRPEAVSSEPDPAPKQPLVSGEAIAAKVKDFALNAAIAAKKARSSWPHCDSCGQPLLALVTGLTCKNCDERP